jgi:hypothetical protein
VSETAIRITDELKVAMKLLQGRADGKTLSQEVMKHLS